MTDVGQSKSSKSGSSNAVSLNLGNKGTLDFDLHYEVTGTDGSIEIEIDVSDPTDDTTTTWKSFDTIDTSKAAIDRQDVYQNATLAHSVRAYAASGDFSDSQVTDLTLMGRLRR